MKRRTIITVSLLGTALTVGLILYLCDQLDNSHVSVTSTGPLDVRLWGIRPDAGDTIYDPNGKKIMETLGLARRDTTVWRDNLHRRDFIFEISDTNLPITFRPLRYSANGEEDRYGSFAIGVLHFQHQGRNFGWFQTTVPRTMRKSSLFGAWKRNIAIDRIDLNLRYYCGPLNKPICVFKGPFKAGRKMIDETGLYEISFVPHPDTSLTELVVRFRAKQQIDAAADALFYDVQGKRHYTGKGWQAGKWKPGKATRKELWYSIPGMSPGIPLKNIAMITIGEEPFGVTVKNLRLSSPGSENRTYAEHLDKIAQILDPRREATRWDRIGNPNKALEVVDLLRGEQICWLCRHLCFRPRSKPGLDLADLTAEQSERLKSAALRWAKAIDPEIRACAVGLGLHCKWPEFVDLAFDLLEHPGRNRFRTSSPASDAVRALYRYREKLSERDVERIAEFPWRRPDRGHNSRLQDCLEHPKSPARVKVFWDLAGCEQPWIWSDAIRQLSSWRELGDKCDSLPEKLKLRVFLTIGPSGFSDPDQIAPKASALLPTLLSSQLLSHYGGTFSTLIRNIPESIDRRKMTAVMIESLRHAEYGRQGWSIWGAIDRIVKYLNLWHGLDVGGLGSDIRKKTPDLDKMDLEAVATEAIEWYDTMYKGADPNTAR